MNGETTAHGFSGNIELLTNGTHPDPTSGTPDAMSLRRALSATCINTIDPTVNHLVANSASTIWLHSLAHD